MDSDLKGLNFYEVLEIHPSATVKDIQTAYKNKALQCNPDKSTDNPNAVEQFLQLSKMLVVLTDTAARTAYDKLLNATLRKNENDLKRQKLKDGQASKEREDLENTIDILESIFQKELERVKKEKTNEITQSQVSNVYFDAYINFLLNKPKVEDEYSFKLKVKWEESRVYDAVNLKFLFSMHGEVMSVKVLEDEKCAFIEYKSKNSAISAKNVEVGYPNCPLKVSFFGSYGQEANNSYTQNSVSDPNNIFSANPNANQTDNTMAPTGAETFDIEAMILEKLRSAGNQGN